MMALTQAMKFTLVLGTMALIVSESQAKFHPLKTEPCDGSKLMSY
jgi:hypothetical protein